MKLRNYKRYLITEKNYMWTEPVLFTTKKEALVYLQGHRKRKTYGSSNWVIVELTPRRIITQ